MGARLYMCSLISGEWKMLGWRNIRMKWRISHPFLNDSIILLRMSDGVEGDWGELMILDLITQYLVEMVRRTE